MSLLLYLKGSYVQARDSLLKSDEFDERSSLLMGAIDVKLGNVDDGLIQMQTALDSMVVYHFIVESHHMLGEILLDLGRNDEAREQLTIGREMAERSEMRWELKQYDALIARF